jgi:hypothetical protein
MIYVVECDTCRKRIRLPDPDTELDVYVPSLDPVPCGDCGSSHVYVSDDVIQLDNL